jgi:hypothetical protein
MNRKKGTDFIRRYDLSENSKKDIEQYLNDFTIRKMWAVRYAENLDEFLVDEMIKALPKEVAELYLIDKKKLLDVVMKDVGKKPTIMIEKNNEYGIEYPACSVCYTRVSNNYCEYCGTRVDWSRE